MLYGRSQKTWPRSAFYFCKRKEHGESRASPSEIKGVLEKYIGKLANGIVEANATIEDQGNVEESRHGVKIFPQAPVIDLETGHRVLCENEDICSESSESSIYLMKNL